MNNTTRTLKYIAAPMLALGLLALRRGDRSFGDAL